MQQIAARYWNEIAKTQTLRTQWAKVRFPLNEDELTDQLEVDAETMLANGTSNKLALSFLTVWPLLAEQPAISAYLAKHPSLPLPAIESEDDAIAFAISDRPMTAQERKQLRALLTEAAEAEQLEI